MARVEQRILIERPIADVFAFHTDPRNMTTISVNTERYRPDRPMGLGCCIAGRTRVAGRTVDWVGEVVEFERNRSYKLKSQRSPLPWVLTYTYAPAGPGVTAVTCVQVAMRLGGLFGRMADSVIERAYERDVGRNLANLKSLLEGAADPVAA